MSAEEPRRSDTLNFTDIKLSPLREAKDLILGENETLPRSKKNVKAPQNETDLTVLTTDFTLQENKADLNQQNEIGMNLNYQNGVGTDLSYQKVVQTDFNQQNGAQTDLSQQNGVGTDFFNQKRLRKSFSETDITNICMDPSIKLNDDESEEQEDIEEVEIEVNLVDLDIGGREKLIKIRTPVSLKRYNKKFCSYSPKVCEKFLWLSEFSLEVCKVEG